MHRIAANIELIKAVFFALPLIFVFLLFDFSFVKAQNNTCIEGTEFGKCSEAKGAPWYCNNKGELIEMCSICGDEDCQAEKEGNAKIIALVLLFSIIALMVVLSYYIILRKNSFFYFRK